LVLARVPAPFDSILGLAPYGTGFYPRPGPARRLSQPLSGLLAHPSSTALLHAAAARGLPPLSKPAPHESRTAETASLDAALSPTSGRLLPRRRLPDALETFPSRKADTRASCPAQAPKAPVKVAYPIELFPSLGAFNPPNPKGSNSRLCSRSSTRPRGPRDPLHQDTFTCDPVS